MCYCYFRPLLKKTGLLKIQVKGIDCMNSNYKRTNVVYAKAKFVNETEEISLQKIADDLSRYFYERGEPYYHKTISIIR